MPNLGPNFYPKLVQIAGEVGMKPEDLIAVMVSESGMNPGAVEKKFKGSGLVGFMPDTLKGLGFKGTWQDFSKLSGEQQLDWLKKLIQGFKAGNGGQPFTSAAQYYTANLWPVALRLPGVRKQDPNAAFIEANPATVTDPKTGQKWSKKYYDVGLRISANMEKNAYKYNPLFDRDKKGSITYGDMMKQVELNKRNPVYQKALAAMKESTNYTPQKEGPGMPKQTQPSQGVASNDNHLPPAVMNTLNRFLQQVAASEKSNKKLYKQFLPNNNIVIVVEADYNNAVEFSRILCTALSEELMADTFTHTDGNHVEVQCDIRGPSDACLATVQELTSSVAEAFKTATAKIGSIDVKTQFLMDKQSSYQQISLTAATTQYRKFLLKFI